MLSSLGPVMDLPIAATTTILLLYFIGKINKLLTKYLVLPLLLMWLHVAGSTLQDSNLGPEWVQNHLHNLGAAATFMMFGLWRLNKLSDRYMLLNRMSRTRANTKALMVCTLQGWTVGVIVGCGIEVLMVTAGRANAVQQGYSGAMGWMDIGAYVISEVLILINYYRLAPRVLRETARIERRG